MEDKFIFANEVRGSWYEGYPSTGDPITVSTIKDILFNKPGLQNINPNAVKGQSFSMQLYVSNTLGGTSEETFTDGVIGVDIDKLPKSDAEKIYNNFQLLCNNFGCLLMCCYSSSYYNPEKSTSGLHIIMRTDRNVIYKRDYKQLNIIYSAVFAYVVNKLLDIDLRPRVDDNGRLKFGLDPKLQSIAHRFFLNYSTIQWNENSTNLVLSNDILNIVKEWFNEDYDDKKSWFEKKNEYKVVNCQFNSIDIDNYNGNTVNLGWINRINIINSLYQWGIAPQEIESILLKICGPTDWEGDKTKPGALVGSIRQSIRTAPTQHPSASQMEYAKNILASVGINVDMSIDKIYQPIEYQFDSIFEEVWESLKDAPYHNRYYNPENVLKIKLNSDEYLTDYKHQINEMVYKYDMTYLVADCMVGKTTLGLNMKSSYGLFDSNDFVAHFHGDTIDLCVPYNSVADNKAKATRRDIKRVRTKKLDDFSLDKRNVFIWNTIMPLYEKYFKLGLVRRLVLFFDESQKIVTDDYRWETIFEMFKVLPTMYKHFVFMTGTPAGELEFLKQYFNNYCIISVDKDIDYNRECKILKYSKFGMGDMINLIEEVIADGRLPLIYANAKNALWKSAIRAINLNRLELGLKPYRVCVYDRPNADKLGDVNKSNSIKNYDIVIATKYCSVGIDFIKDDKRMRCAIIDYINERDCTFHDIWQFTLRNRDQDTITKIVVSDDVASYQNKLYNYWYYVKLFDDIAKIHTYKMVKPTYENEIDVKNFEFIQDVFQIRKFGKLVNGNKHYFDDDKNVKLLSIYYLYVKIFSNINIIKHMLQRRGVVITEIDMEHTKMKMDYTNKKNIYKGFVENFADISSIELSRGKFDNRSYQTDINDNNLPDLYIEDNRIYSSNMHYTDWLIGQFAGKEEWLPILQERDYITKETFATYNRILMIAKRITKREIDRIKRLGQYLNESDLDDLIASMVKKHYGGIIDVTKDDVYKCILLREVINDYDKIIRFTIDNVEFIEDIKSTIDKGDKISAVHKMQIAMGQKEHERIKRLQSAATKKRNSKTITVQWLDTGRVVTYDTMEALATELGCKKQNLKRALLSQKSPVHKRVKIVP